MATYTLHLRLWRRASYRLRLIDPETVELTIHPLLRSRTSMIMREHEQWIEKQQMKLKRKKKIALPTGSDDYREKKESARQLIMERLHHLNQHYHFHFGRISIRNSKTRWGSCSRLKNLNFNYKIIYLPSRLQDYIIVHELCHLKEMNHSRRFWQVVSEIMPDYKELRAQLHTYSLK